MRVLAASGIIVGTLLTAAATADADCVPANWHGASSGARVPTRGTVYVHEETLGWDLPGDIDASWIQFQWENGEGTARLVRSEGAVAVVEYEGPPGSTLKLLDRWDEATDLQLVDSWQPPARAPRVLQYWHSTASWTCSSTDSLMVQLDQPVTAVRVRWHVNGHAVDYLEATRNNGTKTVLELGKINCGGENVPLEQLYDGVGLELYAIRFDGSEVKIEGMPSRMELGDLEGTDGGMEQALTIVATQETSAAQQATRPAQRPPASEWLGVFVLALAGFGLIAALYLLKRAERSASDCSPAS